MGKLGFTSLAIAGGLAGALIAGPALADSIISFDLSVPNSAISGYTGPYGTVTVDLTSPTTATITFASLTNTGNIYLFGDGSMVDVNVNATSWTLSNITGSNAGTGFTAPSFKDGGSGEVDGFGVLNQTINEKGMAFTSSADLVSFMLTDTSASGNWGTMASNVLVANANGAEAAAHIFVTSSPANASNGALATGFAANGGSVSVTPLPATWTMMLLGLMGLGYAVYRAPGKQSVSAPA